MKTELEGVAAQYAEAVLDLATKTGGNTDEAVLIDVATINQLVANSTDLELVIKHPTINAQEKAQILEQLFGGRFQEITLRLLHLLSDKRRLEILPELEGQYRKLMNFRKNLVNASLVSSEPLGDDAIANIKARLAEHLGKKLELEVKVDRSLIGGAVLRVGDQVIDGSLRGKLKAIEKQLLAV